MLPEPLTVHIQGGRQRALEPREGRTGRVMLLARHLDWCRQRNLRGSYIDTRRRAVRNYEQWLGHPAETATESELADWYADISDRITPASRAVFLSHIAAYYRWMVRDYHRTDDPTVRLVRPRLQRRLPRPIGDEDLEVALELAPARVAPWLHLAAFMGLRACEIARLRGEDVRRDLAALVVNDGKGGKQRIIPLHPSVELRLVGYPEHGWMFPHWNRPGPVRPHNVCHACNQYLHSLGITATLHQLRHAFATHVYQMSQDLRLTQELLGHASPTTTAGYAAWDVGRSGEVVRALRFGQDLSCAGRVSPAREGSRQDPPRTF